MAIVMTVLMIGSVFAIPVSAHPSTSATTTMSVNVQQEASVTFNDQTSDGTSVDIADYEFGENGQSVAVWTVDSDGNPGTVLASATSPTSGPETLSLSPSITSDQTLVATIHSSTNPTAENILASDTATIDVDQGSVTFNDQTSDGTSVDIAAYDFSAIGESIAVWTVDSDGNPGTVLASATSPRSGSALTLSLSPSISSDQTLVAAIHSSTNPTTENILVIDTGAIDYEAPPGQIVSPEDNDPDDSPQGRWDARMTSNGGPFWQGQKLVVRILEEQKNTNVQLREADDTEDGQEVGSFVSDVTLDENREAIVDTSNREGDYVIADDGGATIFTIGSDGNSDSEIQNPTDSQVESASWEVTVQSLSASFSDTETEGRTFLELNSNRAGYVVTVTSDELDGDDLENIFAAEIDTDGDDVGEHSPDSNADGVGVADGAISAFDGTAFSSTGDFQLTGSSVDIDDDTIAFTVDQENANISTNFSEVETGDYTLNVEVADTDASASDSISVVEDDDADAEILNPVVRAGEGDNAVIPIQLENTDEATVNVGYNDVNFNLTFDIEDGNDDGVVTAAIDLYTVGRGDLGAVPDDPSLSGSLPNGGVADIDDGDSDAPPAHSYDEIYAFATSGLAPDNAQLDSNGNIVGPFGQLVDNSGTQVKDLNGDGDAGQIEDQRLAYIAVNALTVTDSSVAAVDDDDDITNINLTAIPPDPDDNAGDIALDDPPLDNADYDINVTDGGITGSELAVGTMDVTQTTQDGLRSWTISRSNYEDLDNDVDDAIPEIYASVGSTLTQSDTIAQRDVMVFQYRGTGVFGALAAAKDDGEDYDEAFVELLRGDISGSGALNGESYNYAGSEDGLETQGAYVGDFDFRMEQTNPVANRNGKSLDLAETALINNGVRVIPDQRNSSLFIFIDEQEANVDRNEAQDRAAAVANGLQAREVDSVGQTDLSMLDGEQYEANLSINDGALNNDDVLSVTSDVEIVEKTLTYDTNDQDIIQVAAQSGQVISGSTSVAPGTELDLRIRSTGSSPFLRSPQPVVQADGSFNASVDFSTVAENTSFTASARGFDDEETPGVVGEAPVAQVRIDDQSGDGTTVTVRSVTMSEGGFVVIHDSSLLDGQVTESVIGSSDYLSPGQSSNVEITLDEPLGSNQQLIAMPHLDTNGNQAYDFPSADGPYTANGSAVTDSAQYTIATPTATPDTTTTMPTTTEPMTTTTTEAPDTPTETDEPGTTATDTTTTGGPGFTAGIALVALAAAALLALRRRD